MGYYAHDDVLNAPLDYIKQNCDYMVACDGQPTSYTEANVTNMLAKVAMTAADFNILDGDVNGRKLATVAKENVVVTNTGEFNHVAFIDSSTNKLLYVTEGVIQDVVTDNKVDFPSFDIEAREPIAEV